MCSSDLQAIRSRLEFLEWMLDEKADGEILKRENEQEGANDDVSV